MPTLEELQRFTTQELRGPFITKNPLSVSLYSFLSFQIIIEADTNRGKWTFGPFCFAFYRHLSSRGQQPVVVSRDSLGTGSVARAALDKKGVNIKTLIY